MPATRRATNGLRWNASASSSSSRATRSSASAKAAAATIPTTSRHQHRYWSEESDRTSEEEVDVGQETSSELDFSTNDQFQSHESVWVRYEGKWYPGIVRDGPKPKGLDSRMYAPGTMGDFYLVEYRVKNNVRKFFSPLHGDIKRNTHEIRQLVKSVNSK